MSAKDMKKEVGLSGCSFVMCSRDDASSVCRSSWYDTKAITDMKPTTCLLSWPLQSSARKSRTHSPLTPSQVGTDLVQFMFRFERCSGRLPATSRTPLPLPTCLCHALLPAIGLAGRTSFFATFKPTDGSDGGNPAAAEPEAPADVGTAGIAGTAGTAGTARTAATAATAATAGTAASVPTANAPQTSLPAAAPPALPATDNGRPPAQQPSGEGKSFVVNRDVTPPPESLAGAGGGGQRHSTDPPQSPPRGGGAVADSLESPSSTTTSSSSSRFGGGTLVARVLGGWFSSFSHTLSHHLPYLFFCFLVV